MQVRELGEQGLLKRLYRFCPVEMVGDDAALLAVAENHSLVVTTDTLVDGVHFSDRTTAPADAGWRSAAANLSDLAAMGAAPLGLTIGLGLPGEVEVAWVEQFYQGIVECLQPYDTPIVGGDICRSPVITVAMTALGQVLPNCAIRRSTAQPDDAIVVTGVHGASRAGLELLLHPEQGHSLTNQERAMLIQAHQRPKPRFDAISTLQSILEDEPKNQEVEKTENLLTSNTPSPQSLTPNPRHAGMDSSDGLADAVLQICRASRVGAQLERNLIPFPACLTAWVSESEAIDWALYGGEDFELVLCLPRSVAQKLVQQLAGAAIVGTVMAEPIIVLTDKSGIHSDEILSLDKGLDKGFQHF